MKRMLAEWEEQKALMLSFPHKNSDWADDLNRALSPFVKMASAVAYTQKVIIVCDNQEAIADMFCSTNNMEFVEIATNDTWIRDYGVITIEQEGLIKALDFDFNAWGGKFAHNFDNLVNQALHAKGYLGNTPFETIDFTLEGGSIESDGLGTILTTTECLCNPNRNGGLSKMQVEAKLTEYLGAKRVLWLDYGYLAGDDTDSHIDTLARFVSHDTIMYVQSEDREDEHHEELSKMEAQLRSFTQSDGTPYNLIPLPMTSPKLDSEGKRLPATYANFFIGNNVLLYPTYQDTNDKKVGEIFKAFFPNKEIIGIDCMKLIEQGGSLHCSTMQIG
ncbi:MAG: agmatine deiminase family protein [Campylobacterales bacterium]|nr:agmatine deiminase family protein [Campylobacterales bacterium]